MIVSWIDTFALSENMTDPSAKYSKYTELFFEINAYRVRRLSAEYFLQI